MTRISKEKPAASVATKFQEPRVIPTCRPRNPLYTSQRADPKKSAAHLAPQTRSKRTASDLNAKRTGRRSPVHTCTYGKSNRYRDR